MALSEDASTPAVVTGNSTSAALALTTASFSPPVNSLLVALFVYGHGGASPTSSVTDTGSHTWTAGPSLNNGANFVGIWYTYLTSAPGSITATGHDSLAVNQGGQFTVRVVNGAASNQTGAGSHTASGTGSAWSSSVTTTQNGSWVYVINQGNALSSTLTPTALTTTINNYQDSTGAATSVSGKQTSATSSPGATTLGWTSSSSNTWAWAALEILAAPTIPNKIVNINQAVMRAAVW